MPVQDPPAQGSLSIPMKAALISEAGTIQTLWLPGGGDGLYRFPFRPDMPPLCFEAEGGSWTARCGRGAQFRAGNDPPCTAPLALHDQLIAPVRWQGGEYALYAEADRPGDGVFLPYYLEERTSYTIGRSPNAHICCPNNTVSWEHATLFWGDGAWHIKDHSTNGTYVNGRRVRVQQLFVGDAVYIMGLYLLVGPGYFSLNSRNGRVRFNTPKIRRVSGPADLEWPPCPGAPPPLPLFDRQPRKQVPLEPEAITIDMPPLSLSASKIPFLLRMGSPMVMGGRALFTGNILMALTSLVFPAMTQGLTEKDRKEYEEKRLKVYRAYLAEKEEEIRLEKAEEEIRLNERYPKLSAALRFATERDRLWERRTVDEDFLELRAGAGRRPLIAQREFPQKSFQVERDVLQEELYALAERPVLLEDVPITLSLKRDYVTGVLGLSPATVEVLRGLVLQLALTHSYDEVKLVLLAGEDYAPAFDFLRYLPHCWTDDRSLRFFATGLSDALQVGEFLAGEIDAALDPDQRRRQQEGMVSYVVLALDKGLFDCVESLKKVLRHPEYCGVSIVAAFDGIPKECSQIIDLRGQPKLVRPACAGVGDQPFHPDPCDPGEAGRAVEALMRTKLAAGSRAYALPGMLTFLEMYQAGRVEHLNPLRRWAENNPVKSLAVPIGVGVDGRPFTLDLHEKRQGPHGLVAGMTGSGKSEFIITYILSMAVNFSPDEVAFILIDYKGGGLADAFENKDRGIHLPHLVGTITNLDGAAIDRSLASIKSELTRRQTRFKEVKARTGEGTLDIYDYQKLYRNGVVDEPMPHLFIISDEFAELKQQQPMFMDELISAARIGRSLGVHLILATQKPGGVVNNQIWSNTKFRACLRVQDRGDSMEMLKRPEAAELKQTGRFYLQVGYNEYFALGQSAWCGADYVPQDEAEEEPDNAVQFLDNAGQTVLAVKPPAEKRESQGRQAAAIVRYLSDLAKQQGILPKSLWREPLPAKLELDGLLQSQPPPAGAGMPALLGMVDDPEYQRQFPLYLDLLSFHNLFVVGSAGSGKSTLLRTMLYSLVSRYPPGELNFYLVDFSDHALAGYSSLPHCGAYLDEQHSGDLERLMQHVGAIIARRKRLFADAGVSSYEAYRKLQPIPLVLFLVDGFTKVKGLEGGDRFFMKFPDYLREGSSVGFRFVATCNHTNEVGVQARQELDCRLALQAKDHYEYSDILGVRCKTSPPELNGRGMCVYEGRPLSYQAAMLDCGLDELARSSRLQERLERIARRDQNAPPAERLPMADLHQSYETFCAGFQPGRIPLGYAARDMRPVAVPFQQLHSMSLYFGNPRGIKPVLHNLLAAARFNGMDAVVVRRASDSVFAGGLGERAALLDSTPEGLAQLYRRILAEVTAQNVHRDAYCAQQGIPPTDKSRCKKSARYIRAHSTPILILLEDFPDFCAAAQDPEVRDAFVVFFGTMRGYNIYFAAGFYPNEDSLSSHPLTASFNKEELVLLFGGRYDRVPIKNIPYQITKHDGMDPAYNQFLLKYQETFHSLVMPCGPLEETPDDPDEAPIL